MKNKFWKVLSLATAFCMLFSFAACGEVVPGDDESDDPEIVAPGGDDNTQGKEPETVKHLAYEALPKEDGEKAYEVVGLGEVEGEEIVIPATYEGAPVERIGDYAFCAEEKISESEPVAVMILIDASLSMTEELSDGRTRFDLAIEGALAYVNALGEKDICGVGAVGDSYVHSLNPTPATQKERIRLALNEILLTNTGAYFKEGIRYACELLSAVENVEKRHILILTDGVPGDSPTQTVQYLANLDAYYRGFGITCSVGGIGILGNSYEEGIVDTMTKIADVGHGELFYPETDGFINACVEDLQTIREDITTEISAEKFDPVCKNIQSVTIPESVTSIGAGAFAGCENLTEIIFNGTRAQWNAIEKDAYWNYGMGNYAVHCADDPELDWNA